MIQGTVHYILETIHRTQTSANTQQYDNLTDNIITTDWIFMKILPENLRQSSVECRPLLSPSNGTSDQKITAVHIFMKI